MSTYSKTTIIGYLGNDPKVINFEGGGSVANMSVATSERWKNKQGEPQELTTWHNVVCRNKLADIMEKYAKKGSRMLFEGVLRVRSWEDSSGEKKYITELNVRDFAFMDAKGSSNDNGGSNNSSASYSSQSPAGSNEDDDLPF